jgi:hypothetical protein
MAADIDAIVVAPNAEHAGRCWRLAARTCLCRSAARSPRTMRCDGADPMPPHGDVARINTSPVVPRSHQSWPAATALTFPHQLAFCRQINRQPSEFINQHRRHALSPTATAGSSLRLIRLFRLTTSCWSLKRMRFNTAPGNCATGRTVLTQGAEAEMQWLAMQAQNRQFIDGIMQGSPIETGAARAPSMRHCRARRPISADMTSRADTQAAYSLQRSRPSDVPADGPNQLDIDRQPANKLTDDISGGLRGRGAGGG